MLGREDDGKTWWMLRQTSHTTSYTKVVIICLNVIYATVCFSIDSVVHGGGGGGEEGGGIDMEKLQRI